MNKCQKIKLETKSGLCDGGSGVRVLLGYENLAASSSFQGALESTIYQILIVSIFFITLVGITYFLHRGFLISIFRFLPRPSISTWPSKYHSEGPCFDSRYGQSFSGSVFGMQGALSHVKTKHAFT